MTIDHKILYDTERISRDYASRDYLEPAERVFLDEFGSLFGNMDMLDMGVGGGRTTKYFAPLAKSYIGADYAPAMIRACRKRYGNSYVFLEADARNMAMFDDGSFDFVLFSYNGIDSFSHHDRISALLEINRVLRAGGIFYFSSHNLNWTGLKDIFSIRKSIKKNTGGNIPKGRITNMALNKFRLKMLNRNFDMSDHIEKLRKNKKGHIYDNSLEGRAKVYYITYHEQISQLVQADFSCIVYYSRSGVKTDDENILNTGGWIYYLCNKP